MKGAHVHQMTLTKRARVAALACVSVYSTAGPALAEAPAGTEAPPTAAAPKPPTRSVWLAGTYNFLSLNIQPDVVITDNAVTNVNVAGALTWSDRVKVQTTITHPLTVYTNATSARVGTDGVFNGFLLAPNANLSIAGRTSFLGCVGARDLSFEPDVILNSGGATLPSSATM